MMQKIITIISLALLVISCKQKNNEFLISNESVGQFGQGISITDIKKLVPENQLKRVIEEGEFQDDKYPVYQYFDKSNTHLLDFIPVAELETNSKIEKIIIVSPLFKTKAGWGVGSTFEEVKKSTKIFQAFPDMEVIHIHIATPKLWLMIDKQNLKDGWWNEETKSINVDKIPADAKIKSIIKYIRHPKMM